MTPKLLYHFACQGNPEEQDLENLYEKVFEEKPPESKPTLTYDELPDLDALEAEINDLKGLPI